MLINIHPDNPDVRKIKQVAQILADGGIVIYPTDTVYGLGCDIYNTKAVERICRLRGLDPTRAMLSFICEDISQVAEYSKQIDNQVFRLMRKNLPGPFTFVLDANNKVPKILKNKKDSIGVRIPDHGIIQALVKELGRPILTTSLKSDDEILEYFTDPIDIYNDFENLVDAVIDGGIGGNVPSAIIDCRDGDIKVIREGAAAIRDI